MVGRPARSTAVWNEPGPVPLPHVGGDRRWSWSEPLGGTITNYPNPVPLAYDGARYIFVATSSGRVRKISALTGLETASVDTRRLGCSEDKVIATPAVQLFQNSDPSFQSAILGSRGTPDDLVFVITKTGCGDNSNNKVIAYYASDLSERWTFNEPFTQPMGYGSEGCAIDYDNNRIFCGTDLTSTPATNSLWALNSITGSLLWATNVGSIHTRPQLGEGKLYVASTDGIIRKIDPTGGAPVWTRPTPGIVRDLWPEFRPPLPTRLLYVDLNGNLNAIQDDGPTWSLVWPPVNPGGGGRFVSMPALPPDLDVVFVPQDDGRVRQVNMTTGTLETASPPLSGTLWDPTLDMSSPGGGGDRLILTSTNGSIRRLCIPWAGTVAVEEASYQAPRALVGAPNPFRGVTRIEYVVPFAGRVEIEIFDVAGQRVRMLARLERPAGRHEARWDGLDDSGRAVANGVYFCRMRASGQDGKPIDQVTKVEVLR